MSKRFCVVSHTHWDREWYKSQEVFRVQLVDLLDHLLDELDKEPDFVFHMDAQTIVLDDYLEVRRGRRADVERHVRAGRLVIGPWYLQNDFFLTSGEATVRNLIEGARSAAEYGGCADVGYVPDQFGLIGQLPQILREFGIETALFGRGYSKNERGLNGSPKRQPSATELIWRGADGTEALAVHMQHWYNNAQRFSDDQDRAVRLVRAIDSAMAGAAQTPYLLLMNGVDHLEAQRGLLPLLKALNERLEPGENIAQWRMDDYFRAVADYVRQAGLTLPVHEGEMRLGHDWELLKGTLSSRVYLKARNVRAQNLLEHKLEPLHALLQNWGAEDENHADFMRFLWRLLMQNHPHDSICGCSRDEVHRHMEDRFARFEETAGELLRRGLTTLAQHTQVAKREPGGYSLLALNTLPEPYEGLLHFQVDLLGDDMGKSVCVTDEQGRAQVAFIMERERIPLDVSSPINLPGFLEAERLILCVPDQRVEGFAARCLALNTKDAGEVAPKAEVAPAQRNGPLLENERLQVFVDEAGCVRIRDIVTGVTLEDALSVEDDADCGDSYVFGDSGFAPLTFGDAPCTVQVLERNSLVQRVEISRVLSVNAEYDFAAGRRSEAMLPIEMRLELRLERGASALEVIARFENRAKDHRLRLAVNAVLPGARCWADCAFDVMERRSEDHDPTTQSRVFPNSSFAMLRSGNQSALVMTEGAHEFEHRQDGSLLFTLLRATGRITRNPDGSPSGGDWWVVPENQCLRPIELRFALTLGDIVPQEAARMAQRFQVGLLTHAVPCDPRRLSGGRPAVQDTAIAELFYLPDANPNLCVPDNQPPVSLVGDGLLLTALKRAEDNRGLILRFVNVSEQPADACVRYDGTIQETSLSEQDERLIWHNEARLCVAPKKIITMRLH